MHKTHIFDQKKNPKKNFFYRLTYPIFLRTVTGNKQFIFLGLSILGKIFKGKVLLRTQVTTFLQIFYELMLYSLIIFQSFVKADNNFYISLCYLDRDDG